jgi:NTE family protein
MKRALIVLLMFFVAASWAQNARPRIGLVLSGGGARGLAHVGVLKVLEEQHIRIDAVAGTSMGAIVGGLYASGMSAAEIEREVRTIDWGRVFEPRMERQHLSQRRKEEDFEFSPVLEFGIRNGEVRAPLGAVSPRRLEALLRRYTLPVRNVGEFDRLPIPFRAGATDLENGAAVVLDRGDLPTALRSSMSIPGVFAPLVVEGRVLGDGGLVDNVPVQVARAMGVDLAIVVNIGTPLAGRETLDSALGVTTQMINILTEQNVQRSLSTMGPRDVLIAPQLGQLTAADFERSAEFIALGERGARSALGRLQALSSPPDEHARWRAALARSLPPPPSLAYVTFEGSELTSPGRFAAQLESQPGTPFDRQRAERDVRSLAASGDYLRVDYRLVSREGQDGLVFDLDDKPWGPNYLRVGLDMRTDFNGRAGFNVKLSHNRHWLTPSGTEWRNRIQIGSVPSLFSEIYHPLNWTVGLSNDWFVAAYAGAERRIGTVYDADGNERARFDRRTSSLGLDLGQPWGRFGELRLGLLAQRQRALPTLIDSGRTDAVPRAFAATDGGLRLAAVIDQLDYASFPTAGLRLVGQAVIGEGSAIGRFQQLETSALGVYSAGAHTWSLLLSARGASQRETGTIGRYELGGFHQLSGYRDGQLLGNYVFLTRLGWYRRIEYSPVISRAVFVGATLEAGNAWPTREAVRAGSLRTGMSLYLGADTGLGPVYFGVTTAPRGETGIVLFIGRP